jgi:hypothetical protein
MKSSWNDDLVERSTLNFKLGDLFECIRGGLATGFPDGDVLLTSGDFLIYMGIGQKTEEIGTQYCSHIFYNQNQCMYVGWTVSVEDEIDKFLREIP